METKCSSSQAPKIIPRRALSFSDKTTLITSSIGALHLIVWPEPQRSHVIGRSVDQLASDITTLSTLLSHEPGSRCVKQQPYAPLTSHHRKESCRMLRHHQKFGSSTHQSIGDTGLKYVERSLSNRDFLLVTARLLTCENRS